MRGIFKKFVGLVCVVSLLLTTTQRSCFQIPEEQPLPQVAVVTKTLYVDSSFSFSEKSCIRKAANTWNKKTNGLAQIIVKEVAGPEDVPEEFSPDHVVMNQLTSRSTAVFILDKMGGGRIFGFYSNGESVSQIYLIADRLKEPTFCKIVVTHEIGHALGLEHSGKIGTLMYEDVSGMSNGITTDDLKEFCKKYGCELKERM